MFTALRASSQQDSTDLSTTRVDKPDSPFTSDSCVTYVKFVEGMPRNCNVCEGGAGAGGPERACPVATATCEDADLTPLHAA